MFNIIYGEKCVFKPHELGQYIAREFGYGKLKDTYKFLSYKDSCTEELFDDMSKHLCILAFIDDKDNTEKNLIPLGNLVQDLILNEKIQKECKDNEGVGIMYADNISKYKKEDGTFDNRLVVMKIDQEEFKKYLSECKPLSECDKYGYDKTLGCYYSISNVNEKGIESFKNIGQDYLESFREEEFQRAAMFVKKNWSEDFEKLSLNYRSVDTNIRYYDENDKVYRHVYKFLFQIIRQDGTHIENEHSSHTIECPKISEIPTYEELINLLNYYIDARYISNDDKILLLSTKERKFIFLNRAFNFTKEINDIFKDSTVENVLRYFEENKNNNSVELTFIKDFSDKIKNHMEELKDHTYHLSFEFEQGMKVF